MVISFLLKECCFHPHFPQIPHSVSENSAFYKCYWIRVRGRGNLKRKMRGKGSSKVRKKCKKEKKNRMEGNEKAKLLLPEVHPAHPGSRMSLTRLQCDLKESNAIYNWTLPCNSSSDRGNACLNWKDTEWECIFILPFFKPVPQPSASP